MSTRRVCSEASLAEWRYFRTLINNDVSSVRSPRFTGPPPSPVAMAIRRSCGPQLIDFYNSLHHLEHSTPRQTLLFTSPLEKVRSANINVPPPVINLHDSTTFADLRSRISLKSRHKLLKSAPNKHCQLDPYQLGYWRSLLNALLHSLRYFTILPTHPV